MDEQIVQQLSDLGLDDTKELDVNPPKQTDKRSKLENDKKYTFNAEDYSIKKFTQTNNKMVFTAYFHGTQYKTNPYVPITKPFQSSIKLNDQSKTSPYFVFPIIVDKVVDENMYDNIMSIQKWINEKIIAKVTALSPSNTINENQEISLLKDYPSNDGTKSALMVFIKISNDTPISVIKLKETTLETTETTVGELFKRGCGQ